MGLALRLPVRTETASGSVVPAAVLSMDRRTEAAEAAEGEGEPRLTQWAREDLSDRPAPRSEERSELKGRPDTSVGGGGGVGLRVVDVAGGASRPARKGARAGAHMEAER